ncbi:MAG TPA: UbiH/UbiF/VisC/COQ6 family ubiquinone biosynthesis hydroxylase [Alphaproteobacteria bacterium]|nr:UbiH/UbiF/VisC/COQ6 family ubiquinone biosynthesis hydroxylase [Alphaproteobacteria bacterium]
MADRASTTATGDHGAARADILNIDVLIVGGGMVGLTLALALGGAGLEVVVVDREDPTTVLDAPYDGRASAIAYGSRQVLEGLGAWPGLAHAAEPILDIRVSDGDAPLFLHYDHREVGEEPLGHIVENRAIRRALFARQSEIPAIDLRAPAGVAHIEFSAGGVTATLGDGARIRASLAVAADGRNSWLREQAGISVTRWRYKQTGIVCTMGHARPHRGVAHERFLPAGPFAVLPMTDMTDIHGDPAQGHRSSIVWTEDERLAPAMMALDDGAFSAELGRRFGPWYGDVRVLGGRWSYPLSLLHANRYVAPRLALVGDAAHAIHPIAGQGLNLGIRGVAALAEVMVEAARLGLDIGSADVLARYERWRRFDAMALVAVTDGLNRLFSNAVPPVRLIRDLGLAAVNVAAPARRFFMRHAMGMAGDLPRLMKGERL